MTMTLSQAALSRQGEVGGQLDGYFCWLQAAFSKAAERTQTVVFSRSVAGHTLQLRCAGESFSHTLTRALAHLPAADNSDLPSLEILAWEERASGIGLPPPPWPWPTDTRDVRFVLPKGGEEYRLEVFERGSLFLLHSLRRQQVICWTPDASRLTTHIHASPLLSPLHWWASGAGLCILHAGCVATGDGAVLLVGPGGSGKSTTALLCAMEGLQYLSDDYCLVRPDASPEAYCLFNSGKLHRDHLQQFPELASRSCDLAPDRHEKPVIFMHDHFAGSIATRRPLQAVLAPRVSGLPDTQLIPTSPAEALRALAPSTLFQLPVEGGGNLRAMAALVRQLPCYRLELGTQLDQIPQTIRQLLQSAG